MAILNKEKRNKEKEEKGIPTKDKMTEFLGKLSEQEYDLLPALRNTHLKEFMQSPAHYKYAVTAPRKDASYFLLGNYVHTAILEPEKVADKFVSIDVKSRNSKEYKNAAQVAYAQGKLPLLAGEIAEAKGMIQSALNDSAIIDLIKSGYPELTATAKLDDVWAKCRMDLWIPEEGHIVDVKTSADSAFWFSHTVRKYSYDIQAAYYSDIVEKASGSKVNKFSFILIEKKPPYICRLFELSGGYLDWARARYRPALKEFKKCLELDHWPAFDNSIPVILTSPEEGKK